MRLAVLNAFAGFTGKFEGSLDFMYLDDHVAPDGSPDPLVTTGRGNLIDPVGAALALPWLHRGDDAPATQDEITAEWTTIKDLTDMAPYGGNAFRSYTSLYLAQVAIDDLDAATLAQNERVVSRYFPKWESFPADAQLGILSMAWAMGPGFPVGYPLFTIAANRGDWSTAAAESTIVKNPPAGRNAANKLLFTNAAHASNPDTLYYPRKAGSVAGKVVTVLALLGISGWGAWRAWKGSA